MFDKMHIKELTISAEHFGAEDTTSLNITVQHPRLKASKRLVSLVIELTVIFSSNSCRLYWPSSDDFPTPESPKSTIFSTFCFLSAILKKTTLANM